MIVIKNYTDLTNEHEVQFKMLVHFYFIIDCCHHNILRLKIYDSYTLKSNILNAYFN